MLSQSRYETLIPQLLPIIHEIETVLFNSPTVVVRGVFLDISKTFDKVWHDGLIFKLNLNGDKGELLSLLKIVNKKLF